MVHGARGSVRMLFSDCKNFAHMGSRASVVRLIEMLTGNPLNGGKVEC